MRYLGLIGMLIVVLGLTACEGISLDSVLRKAEQILDIQSASMQKYEELKKQNDPHAALKTVVWLKGQSEVQDSGVSEDGNIWIQYEIGLRGLLILNLPLSEVAFNTNPEAYKRDGELDGFTRISSIESPSSKKAIILLPFDKTMPDKAAEDVRDLLESIDYNVTVRRGQEVTLREMETLEQYKVIYITTHGGCDPKTGVSITLGEIATPLKLRSWFKSLLGLAWGGVGITTIYGDRNTYLSISGEFINDFKYPGSLVVVNACNSLHSDTCADAFLNSGAAIYFGWTAAAPLEPWVSTRAIRALFQELAQPNTSVLAAYTRPSIDPLWTHPSIYPNWRNLGRKFSIEDLFPLSIYRDVDRDGGRRFCYSDLQDYPPEKRCPGDPDDQELDWEVDFRYKGDDSFVLNPGPVQGACTPAPAGLIGWWPGDGDFKDITGGNHGIMQGGVIFGPGMVDKAFGFDGIDDYVFIPFNEAFNFPPEGQFTIEAWVKPLAPLSRWFQAIVVKSPPSTEWDWGLYLDLDYHFMAGRHVQHILQSKTIAQVGQWYHIALTYDNAKWQLYVNGLLEAQHVGTKISQSLGSLALGRKGASGSYTDYFHGFIDEVSIYNRALRASEIKTLFEAGSSGKCKEQIVKNLAEVLKHFAIYVKETRVRKGWDWILLPDGKLVHVTPGKYMRIQEIERGRKWEIGFEDLTEELGSNYQCDYDYDDPLLQIESIGEGRLLIRGLVFEGNYRHDLYFMNQLIYENFGAGQYQNYGQWTVTY